MVNKRRRVILGLTSERFSRRAQTPSQDSAERTQLELAHRMAIELAQFKAGFLARTSHELRSPLNGLIGAHQLILSDLCDSPEEERQFIAQAHESALKLLQLLDEVIHVSKAEYGSSTLEIQPLSLASVLHEVYGLTHLLAENRNLKFQIAFPDDSLYVLADPKWLRYVLVSLISGAVSLMQEGAIALTVQCDSQFAHLLIEDDRPAESWQEATNLVQAASPSQSVATPSPSVSKGVSPSPKGASSGFSLLLAQTVLEFMNGRLALLSTPSQSKENVTQIQCSIPLVEEVA